MYITVYILLPQRTREKKDPQYWVSVFYIGEIFAAAPSEMLCYYLLISSENIFRFQFRVGGTYVLVLYICTKSLAESAWQIISSQPYHACILAYMQCSLESQCGLSGHFALLKGPVMLT